MVALQLGELGDWLTINMAILWTFSTGPVVRESDIANLGILEFNQSMSMLEQIEEQVKRLSVAEQQALREWLDDILEEELEFTDEFKAKIEKAKRDIAEGRGRVVEAMSWTGRGTAMRVHSPDFDSEFSKLP